MRGSFVVCMLAVAALAAGLAAAQAGARSAVKRCGASTYSYAGVQAATRADGIAASLTPVGVPRVADGHVGGWIGLGGPSAGPRGTAEWIQVGFASFMPDQSIRLYYEVAVGGAPSRYVELSRDVAVGERHDLAVLELPTRASWWQVWVDGRPVGPAVRLPGSHRRWSPQALAENWTGDTGACNTFGYRFSNVRLAAPSGGWRPLEEGYVVQDRGYRVLQTSRDPRTFVARSA